MGADFKEKTRRTFEKCWDKAAVEANTPDLFCKSTERSDSRFYAEALGSHEIHIGDYVFVRVEEGRVIGRKGITPVMTIPAPTPCLIQSITEGCNVACANVVGIDPISGVVEVTIH